MDNPRFMLRAPTAVLNQELRKTGVPKTVEDHDPENRQRAYAKDVLPDLQRIVDMATNARSVEWLGPGLNKVPQDGGKFNQQVSVVPLSL
jgi:hypothetical protein